MNNTDNGRTLARSRANRRLRNLTIGTAAFGIAATGSLGWLAAMSYDGSTSVATTAVAGTTADSSTTTATAATPTPATTTTSAGAAATAAPVVTTTSGTGHATTGGS